ncbi:hypothetical protein QUV83_03555 [Cellulomonas cellasea]|uniref:DUF6912 family protein n=1 Tax=Cellulomonas cellasea TaxID=43670 RepID=UPI0025A3FBAC|nr:hypothetical protein [Cellulomonas cellasea]MDM8083841.1 hypothetical protein [Cellulomonas cellasea]
MRIYLPATLDELDDPADGGQPVLGARRVHAVTPALRAALPEEDEEELEYAAQLAAADDALLLVAGRPHAPQFRLVLSADVPDADVSPVGDDGVAPSLVELRSPVPLAAVACGHVDEPDAAADLALAVTGDEGAIERLAERDLLWYDVTELGGIPR